jgi:predicted SAM-dependent methyltransferase
MAEPQAQVIELGGRSGGAGKRVLNAGCGPQEPGRLHSTFRNADWTEVRLDIDKSVNPDIVGTVTDLRAIENATFDAVWCSHNLEHLHTPDVPKALAEFHRVLRPDGFVLVSTPDLEAVAELVVNGRLEDTAYESPAGPITALDMLFGLGASIAQGNHYMAHNTGFTAERLGRLLIETGFAEVYTKNDSGYNLWGVALMPEADTDTVLGQLRKNRLDFFLDAG